MAAPTRIRLVYGALAVATLALAAWFLVWSDVPAARYARMPCQCRAIYEIGRAHV